MHTKTELRRRLLDMRKNQPPNEAAFKSMVIQKAVAKHPAFVEAGEALLYMAANGEVSTGALLEELLLRDARILLPRCEPGKNGSMHLASIDCTSQLATGSYGIQEPCPTRCEPVEDFSPDVALIPGVGFDRAGTRLGYGGGYYDRLLANPAFAETVLIGLAYDFQIIDELPRDPWDAPVHFLITESTIIETRP